MWHECIFGKNCSWVLSVPQRLMCYSPGPQAGTIERNVNFERWGDLERRCGISMLFSSCFLFLSNKVE